jgi:hypothetical protein
VAKCAHLQEAASGYQLLAAYCSQPLCIAWQQSHTGKQRLSQCVGSFDTFLHHSSLCSSGEKP